MPRSTKPSFVLELPLRVDSSQNCELQARFNAAIRLYNNVLGEAKTRMELVRNSEVYQTAKKISRNHKKERSSAFSKAREAYRFTDYDLQAYANQAARGSKWIPQKIDAQVQQKLATRAFKAVERVLFGRAKDVRFKVESRFRSVEGKTNKQGIRWKDNRVVWAGLELPAIIDTENVVVQHGLSCPVKYCRLIRRELNGKRRWFVQLVLEGVPYQKPQNYVSDGLIGLDLNVSKIAFVADNHADLLPFADKVPTFGKEITRLQRKIQRSQRGLNPDNFESDFKVRKGRKTVIKKGKPKKGKQQWKKSSNYRKIASLKRELERRKTAYAKSQNRRVVNEILRHGKNIKTENVSVKGWQKRYGKAISAKSPGFVQSELKRKAENAGGSFAKFSTQKTALSQTHLDGSRIKKSLSQRVHRDVMGIPEHHRDLFSAFLSRYVNQDKLVLQDAQNEYLGLEPILLEAHQRYLTRKQVSHCVAERSLSGGFLRSKLRGVPPVVASGEPVRVGASESRKSDSPSERVSNESLIASQIAESGEKLDEDVA
ncbi:transposase [Brasilonema sp. UFV-L1]|uniref:transposase n=1 Tax=Brasilonema sp. UFV-L1 TaxID=2234130 RepID=UPI00145F7077|nr:transposase [Brasilonema sp. UFV-L1]NMG10176.1 transposase [Brasilonema sp. UFV-L1]